MVLDKQWHVRQKLSRESQGSLPHRYSGLIETNRAKALILMTALPPHQEIALRWGPLYGL